LHSSFLVKLILTEYDSTVIQTAFDYVTLELDVDSIDTLIVAFPPRGDGELFSINKVSSIWKTVSRLKQDGKVDSIGVSDLDTSELQELFEWAEIKPDINQVNLASCCVMPPEMITFARENNISLLTHSDPRDILPKEDLQEILQQSPMFPDSEEWKFSWVVRFSVLVRSRGVVQNKGFILCISK